MFDNLQLRFVLSSDGTLYLYEQIFIKGQEFTVQLTQVLNCENAAEIVTYGEKRIVLLVERNTGIVNTLFVD